MNTWAATVGRCGDFSVAHGLVCRKQPLGREAVLDWMFVKILVTFEMELQEECLDAEALN